MKGAIVTTAVLASLSTGAFLELSGAFQRPAVPANAHARNTALTGSMLGLGEAVNLSGSSLASKKSARLGSEPLYEPTAHWRLFAAHAQERQSEVAQAPAEEPRQTQVNQAQNASGPEVDETALRYFARQGDQRRLDAEIARLRALYPDWTPPSDPLAVPAVGDPQLDAMWNLYSQGKYAELRKAIADRQASEPQWQVPGDMLERLKVAESREKLINASNLKQYETVIRTASETSSLLTCAEVDVMWRLAEAFAETKRPERARDAYKYILDNCDKPAERVATIEKAIPLLPRPLITQLFALERPGANGVGEFQAARLVLSRQIVADAGNDPKLNVSESDLNALKAVADPDTGTASDAELLGWYYIRRDKPEDARTWFTKSRDREDTATASQGLALALIALDKPGEAESVLYKWRDESDETKKVYMAAAANYLATEPRIAIDADVLARMAQETGEAHDSATAQQFGWYARDLNQHRAAAEWFTTALQWKPDDEPSAYGLVLTRNLLGDREGVREIQRLWAGRSQRIAKLGEPNRNTPRRRSIPAPTDAPVFDRHDTRSEADQDRQPVELTPVANSAAGRTESSAPRVERYAQEVPVQIDREPAVQVLAGQAAPSRVRGNEPARNISDDGIAARVERRPERRNCGRADHDMRLTGEAALASAWCLADLNRPMEAIAAFERAIETGSPAVRREAAWGQSLAYLSRNLTNDAAVSASKAPQSAQRTHQLEVEILTQRALGFFEQKRYVEALRALDQRARIATERVDLMTIRGYAYLNLKRLGDAERVFTAMAAVGDRVGYKGLAVIRETRRLP